MVHCSISFPSALSRPVVYPKQVKTRTSLWIKDLEHVPASQILIVSFNTQDEPNIDMTCT
jgi:hypothetical protein